jgi:uncharacterized protein YjbJ (UPF0337 family)
VIQAVKQLLLLLQAVFRLFGDRQLLEAGKAQQREADMKEVEERVEQAKDALATPDPVRDERLRDRFDRSRRSQ